MTNISLKIGVNTSKEKALAAINSVSGLSQWWTKDTQGDTNEGGLLTFRFNGHGPDMKVLLNSEDTVAWQCVAGPEEWLGTEIKFQFKDEEETVIYFQHLNWRAESSFHCHCAMKWATFMLSLKQYLEQGSGRPFPDDIQINTL